MSDENSLRVVLGVVAGLVVLTVPVVLLLAAGQPIGISPPSIAALSAWSTYATAVATFLLVLVAVFGGFQARNEFRTGHRPVPTLGGAGFRLEGVEVLIGNVGPGSMVNVHLRVWVAFASFSIPGPEDFGIAIEHAANLAARERPHFEADLGAIPPGGFRTELLRFGPRANTYEMGVRSGCGSLGRCGHRSLR